MSPIASLLTLLLFVLSIVGTPVQESHPSLSFTKRINSNGLAINLSEIDRARTAALRDRAVTSRSTQSHRRPGSTSAINQVVIYLVTVGVGDPLSYYNLAVDTGSANTWVGANSTNPYEKTSTSEDTLNTVSVLYGSGFFDGEGYIDTVTLGPGLAIRNQSIGAALFSEGFEGLDGILGLGPENLTQGTLFPDEESQIPTITQRLYMEGTIPDQVLGVSFATVNKMSPVNGELTFGGIDSTKYTGDLIYNPVTETSPSSNYWGIDLTMAYGDQRIMSLAAGIVDTGSTLILIASDAYSAYKSATGAQEDSATGLLRINQTQYDSLQNVSFNTVGGKFTLIPNAQIWPRAHNMDIGGDSDAIYLIISDIGPYGNKGLGFVLGKAFLERYYSVYDTTRRRVGLAATPYTSATTN